MWRVQKEHFEQRWNQTLFRSPENPEYNECPNRLSSFFLHLTLVTQWVISQFFCCHVYCTWQFIWECLVLTWLKKRIFCENTEKINVFKFWWNYFISKLVRKLDFKNVKVLWKPCCHECCCHECCCHEGSSIFKKNYKILNYKLCKL